jgi:hypothetical protein
MTAAGSSARAIVAALSGENLPCLSVRGVMAALYQPFLKLSLHKLSPFWEKR